MAPHPLDILTASETNKARDIVAGLHPDTVINFREIYLEEPPKKQLIKFLTAEHAGEDAPRPARAALVQYDTIGKDGIPHFNEAVVDLEQGKRLKHAVVDDQVHHAGLTL